MKTKFTWLLIASSVVLFSACNDRDRQSPTEQAKENYVEMAYAVYTDSLTTATNLQTAVNTFVTTPTEDNLAAARAAYKLARVPYQQSEIMRWDTIITEGKNLTTDGGLASVDEWEGQVNAWPLDENHIVSLIEGDDPINTQLLLAQNGVDAAGDEAEANVTTGVHAIEFMLWGEDLHGTDAGAGERIATEFDQTNCLDTYCERRAQYLTAAMNLYVNDLMAMQAEWSPTAVNTAGTLAYNFIHSSLGIEYIVGALNAMAADELSGARMGSGLLLRDPEESHDCFSDLSHVAIYYNFQGIKNAFYGHYGDVTGVGIADLIKQKDEETFNRIDVALTSIETKMRAIYEAGEREVNTVRFDQIIGQSATGTERVIAEAAVDELTALGNEFQLVVTLLQLQAIDTSGSGEG